MFKATHGDSGEVGINVAEMTVDKPLIATGANSQLFRVAGSADWDSLRLNLQIYSVNAAGGKTTDHARCTVKFDKKEAWLKDWKRNAYLVKSRLNSLQNAVEQGQNHKMKSGIIYKLFGSLVDYGSNYKGMQEVVLDSTELEATSRVQFQTTPEDEDFHLPPYWIDSLGQIAGFIMNANDAVDSKSQVFINHGWDSMRVAVPLSRRKTYRTYNRMQNVGGTMFVGDTYTFDGDSVIAIFQGVKVRISALYSQALLMQF